MEEGQIVLSRLVPPDQDSPKAIQPPMRAFHHPSSGSNPRLAFERPRFFTTRRYVGREANLAQRLPHFLLVVPFVQTHALGPLLGGAGPLHHAAVHRVFHQFQVGAVGPGHHHAHGHPVALGQQTAFAPALGPVGGIGAGFFPPRVGPSSSPHPCSASSSPAPSIPHTVPPPPATASGIPPRLPTPETGHGPWNGDTSPWPPERPPDSRYASHRKWPRHTGDREPGVARRQSAGCSEARARRPPTRPRGRPRLESWSSLCSRLPVAGFVSVFWLCSWHAGYHKPVIRIGTKLAFCRFLGSHAAGASADSNVFRNESGNCAKASW
jgi:hypothetical protein